jgi:hypothetical protein
MVKIFTLFLLPIFLWGVNMKFINLTEEVIPIKTPLVKKRYFNLFASSYIQKISKKDIKLIFFNRKSFMLKNNYYLDGFFKSAQSHLFYKKAYRLSTKLYFFNVNGTINNQKITAKEVVYDGYRNYTLKNCEVKSKYKILRRKVYIIRVD